MKVFIHTDLEGVCDFYDWDEANISTSRGIGYTKEFLTNEINAAIDGIRRVDDEAEIIVEDGHGGGWLGPNIIAEKLDRRTKLLAGRFYRHLAGIDSTFDLLMLIGAHSMAGTQRGLMNHTLSKNKYYNVWLNNVKMGEIGICAAIAGYWDVPLAMVSGDYWAVEEAKGLISAVEGVAVKTGMNRFHAQCLHPGAACDLIREAAERAARGKENFARYVAGVPVEIKVDYLFTEQADKAELFAGAERIGGRSVIFKDNDLLKAIDRFLGV